VKTFWQILYGADLSGSSADLFQLCEVIEDTSMWLPGDWVFFKIAKNKISHSGIYLGNNKFIHSTTRAGVIISDLNEPYYKKHFYAVGRLKK
jgi:lipoprotein Spr